MATSVYIVKRRLKSKRRNGQPHYRYALRWRDPVTRKQIGETTGTADMTEARELQRLGWAEVNRLVPPPPEPEAPTIVVTWKDCRDALKRAMEADNLRSGTMPKC